jgi:hypothetical protein
MSKLFSQKFERRRRKASDGTIIQMTISKCETKTNGHLKFQFTIVSLKMKNKLERKQIFGDVQPKY